MVPPGWASPNAALNISIAAGMKLIAALQSFGYNVAKVGIQTGNGMNATGDNIYQTVQAAAANGVALADPVYLQCQIVGVFAAPPGPGPLAWLELATIFDVLTGAGGQATGAAALQRLNASLYPYADSTAMTLNNLVANPAVKAAVLAQLALA